MMLMVMMHGEDDADEDDDDTDDDDDDEDSFVAYLIWTLVSMLGDLHSGTLFFDPRFRGDPVHLLLHLRVTSVFFFLLFLRIWPINNNNHHHHNVYRVPRILKTTFNTTSTIKTHWGSAASGVSLLNNLAYSKKKIFFSRSLTKKPDQSEAQITLRQCKAKLNLETMIRVRPSYRMQILLVASHGVTGKM